MNDLIPIKETNGKQAVSARDLYQFLGYNPSQWKRWYESNILNEAFFEENVDYEALDIMSNGNPTKDFALTIEMAKELSMLARTDKGKQARQYFIECEKKLRQIFQIPQTYSEALKLAASQAEKIEHQSQQLRLQQPKVLFADAVTASNASILVGELAKILKQNGIEIGQNRLFEWLRNNSYLIRRQGTDYNMPTQKSMELELFQIKETPIVHGDGHVTVSKTVKVTGRGQEYFINKFLSKKAA